MKLEGRVAVVTGASSGIGKAIATKLSQEGCIVALASRNLEKLNRVKASLTGKSAVYEMDVSNTASVQKAFKSIGEELKTIDILINCAGIMPLTYLKNRHLDEWLETIEVNVKGSLRCIHETLPYMTENKSGHIINISSVDGKELYAGGAVYGASKAALNALSTAMRMELSPNFNIKVTAIEPGTVDTPLRENITDKELLEDKNYNKNESKLSPNDIANAVMYALSQPDTVNVNELLIKPTGKA